MEMDEAGGHCTEVRHEEKNNFAGCSLPSHHPPLQSIGFTWTWWRKWTQAQHREESLFVGVHACEWSGKTDMSLSRSSSGFLWAFLKRAQPGSTYRLLFPHPQRNWPQRVTTISTAAGAGCQVFTCKDWAWGTKRKSDWIYSSYTG